MELIGLANIRKPLESVETCLWLGVVALRMLVKNDQGDVALQGFDRMILNP